VGQVWSLGSDFRTTLSVVEIHPSARKHGVDDEDIRHAIDRAITMRAKFRRLIEP
jgi:hypothetical protein